MCKENLPWRHTTPCRCVSPPFLFHVISSQIAQQGKLVNHVKSSVKGKLMCCSDTSPERTPLNCNGSMFAAMNAVRCNVVCLTFVLYRDLRPRPFRSMASSSIPLLSGSGSSAFGSFFLLNAWRTTGRDDWSVSCFCRATDEMFATCPLCFERRRMRFCSL